MPSDKNNKKPQIRIHHDEGPVSPYIIHLSREDAEQEELNRPSHLQALAASLSVDADDFDVEEQDDLSLDFSEIVDQLRESDFQQDEIPEIDTKASSVTATRSQAPVEGSAFVGASELEREIIDPAHRAPSLLETDEEEEEIVRESLFSRLRFTFTFPSIAGPRTRAVAAFVALSFALVLPLHAIQQVNATKITQAEITDAGRNAIDNFLRGTQALESDRFDVAGIDFERATEDFRQAEESLGEIDAAVATLVSVIPQTDKTYESVRGLITSGKELSLAASNLTEAADELASRESLSATTKLTLLNSYVDNALPHIQEATTALEKVSPDAVPAEYQTAVTDLQERVPSLQTSMEEFSEFSETLVTIMGGERKMRYLVVFQNNTELRPTGGFPGSFAEMDVENGEIININIPEGGTYDVQGQLTKFVEAPQPLSLINPRWEFHDSAWFPDFPTSAKKMLWFYENAGGPTVDGVLAINATMMPKLLEITGPIEMPEYGRTIDAENFLFETQKIVEYEYDQYSDPESAREEEAPKQFIGDLAPKVLERLTDADMATTLTMLNLLGEGLDEKDVLLYFENNALQSKIESLGWSGELKQTTGDYLMVVNTNLGGGKTDTIIDQNVDIFSQVQEDGSIINTVTITKKHRGLKTALFEGLNNVDYIRLYVPKGSELISADGFEIPPAELFDTSEVPLAQDEDLLLIESNRHVHTASQTDIWDESGKTVFGNWIQTKPGETETVTFTYRLPITLAASVREHSFLDIAKSRLGFKDLETHTLLIQKQPGVLNRETNATIEFPDGKTVLWSSHTGTTPTNDIVIENEKDHFIRFLIENEVN